MTDLNKYVVDQLPEDSRLVEKMIESCKRTEKHLTDLGFTALAAQFRDTRIELEGIQKKLKEQKKTAQDKWDDKSKGTILLDLSSFFTLCDTFTFL